ncbi:class I adenylate-forming enzyme family protein [Ralstonia soli]|uniref:Acyl--CoA ligase n=1 Tax=Ralstonia soli TaxID=2953896 RepID=A0ABT1AEA1_9RALS|nr:class I adenylate-forming enzyme family protein [Ralstonia soli]MCO5396718.1 acyl--CoA ligase [Ralstonia soli]
MNNNMLTADIEAYALNNRQHVALRSGDSVLTYGQLLEQVDELANRLKDIGIGSNSTVASLCENRIEVILLYYAMSRIGGTFISINPSLTAPEVAYILDHASVTLLLHDEKMRMAAEAAAAQVPTVRKAIFEDLGSVGGIESSEKSTVASTEIFQIAYTSGSTGKPKAVAFDQVAEVAGNQSLIDLWGMTPDDVTVVALPLGFLYGLSTASSMTLQAGAEVVLMRRFHPREVLEAFVNHKATVFHGVPTMFAMMLEYVEQNDMHIDLSFMRLLVSAGAPLTRELRDRFEVKFNKKIDDYYGLTEVRPVFGRFADDPSPVPDGAIGKAAPGVIIKIVDADGSEVKDGEVGELLVRAPSTTLGYYKNPELTAATFESGLMRTGDLGYRDENGFYYLTGRIKDIIIRGGANIAPAEVEETIATHPDVKSVSVIGVPDEKFGQVVAAYVVPRDIHHISKEGLVEYCKVRLADFKVPSQIYWSDDLPLGVTGKVDKKALLARWTEERASTHA